MSKHVTREEMIALYQKTFNDISEINTSTITVKISASFKGELFSFEVTVFDSNNENRTFSVYDFYDLEKVKTNVETVVDVIDTDNFVKVVALSDKFAWGR